MRNAIHAPIAQHRVWLAAGLLAVIGLWTAGCGDGNATKPPVPTPPTGAEVTPPKGDGDKPAGTAAGDSTVPKGSGSTHLPKLVSVVRWDNAKLGKDTLQAPESVAEDPVTGDLYVSNIGPGGNPKALDGNGYITRLSATGAVLDAKKFPPEGGKLNGPKGILVQGDLLWVVDIDTVKAFDIRGKEGNQMKSFTVPGAEFANDVAVGPDGAVYISDTVKNFVYMIKDDNVNPGIRKVITRATPGANGLFWNAKTNKLLVCGTDFAGVPQRVQQIEVGALKDGDATVTDLTEPIGMLDGLAALPSGAVLVSDWKMQGIWWVSADGKTHEKALEGFVGPADFLILKDGKTIMVPDMGRNELVVFTFEKALE